MTRPTDPDRPKKPPAPAAPVVAFSYNIDEAAKVSGISRSALYKLIKAGTLPSGKFEGRRIILREDLEALIRSHITKDAA